MREVKFRFWIPLKYDKDFPIPDTGIYSGYQLGFFHCIMQEADGECSGPVGCIEDTEGNMHAVGFHHFQFILPYAVVQYSGPNSTQWERVIK